MFNRKEIRVHVKSLSQTLPCVDVIELNGEVVGYLSENRDWNKEEKPVSVVSTDGVHLGDFCCIAHATTHIVQEKTGIVFDDVEIMKNAESRMTKVKGDFLDALFFALLSDLKGKRPH
ncbi:hypothetical protein [Citrobacter werkmanii]|uniref:hypothetical protein n=1 Tax=Citrobacter werkmanii TaxID=67827 RepID=UPI00300C2DAA